MTIPGRVWKGGSHTDFLRKFSGWKLKKKKHDNTWQSVEGRQAHRLPEEGVFRVVEAEGLVNDVGLRLHPKTQQGHGFAVLRHELDLATAKKKTFVCAVGVVQVRSATVYYWFDCLFIVQSQIGILKLQLVAGIKQLFTHSLFFLVL